MRRILDFSRRGHPPPPVSHVGTIGQPLEGVGQAGTLIDNGTRSGVIVQALLGVGQSGILTDTPVTPNKIGTIGQPLYPVGQAGTLSRVGTRTGVITQSLQGVRQSGTLTDTISPTIHIGTIGQPLQGVTQAGILSRLGRHTGSITQALQGVQQSGILTDTPAPLIHTGTIGQPLMAVRQSGVLHKIGNRTGVITQPLQGVGQSGSLVDTPPGPTPHFVNFGAKTPAGFGGSPCGYGGSSPLSITSGNTGSVWAIDSHNHLVPSGTYGSANHLASGPYALMLTDGVVTLLVVVTILPNAWSICPIPLGTNADTATSCQLLSAANSSALALGDTIYLRAGDYNPSRHPWTIKRAAPMGTWTGIWTPFTYTGGVYIKGVWSGPNWVVIEPDSGATAILETIGFNGTLSTNQYFSLRNITFNLANAVNGVTLTNGASILEFTGCTFTSAPAMPTVASQAAVGINSNTSTNSYVSVTNCAFANCFRGVNVGGSHIQMWGCTGTNLYCNLIQFNWTAPVTDVDLTFNTVIGLVQIVPTHADFIILASSATSGVSSHFAIGGNVCACGGQVGSNSTGQGFFEKHGTQPSTATITDFNCFGNFYLGTAAGGIPVDQLDSTALIEGNTVVTDSSYTVFNPSAVRLNKSNAPAVKYNATVGGVVDISPVAPSVLTGNVTLSGDTLTAYQTYFANPQLGAGNTSLAQILTDWANKVGGPLDTPSPKVGAIGTGYVDYLGRTTRFPY